MQPLGILSNSSWVYAAQKLFLCCAGLWTLRAVFGTGLHALGNTLGIQRAADNMVTNTRQVLNTAATDHYHAMLLQVVPYSGNVSADFNSV